MSVIVVTNAAIYADGYDISGDSNKASIQVAAAELDDTRFGQSTKVRTPGAIEATGSIAGFYKADNTAGALAIDDQVWADIFGGTVYPVVTISPTGAADGDRAYFMQAEAAQYNIGAAYGGALPFDLALKNYGSKFVGGKVGATGSKASTGTGTIYQLGALTATQKLYAALHVLSVTGSVTVKVQSAPLVGFGSPTDRITFTLAAGKASQFSSVAGAVTDQFWRIAWTVVTGPASIVASFGVM
jgi:hypothetical protein